MSARANKVHHEESYPIRVKSHKHRSVTKYSVFCCAFAQEEERLLRKRQSKASDQEK